jgi:hypothetical protein
MRPQLLRAGCTHTKRVGDGGFDNLPQFRRDVVVVRFVIAVPQRNRRTRVRFEYRRHVARVADEQIGRTRDRVVEPADEIVFIGWTLVRDIDAADSLYGLRRRLPGWQRVQLQQRGDRGVHPDSHAVDDTIARVGIRDVDRLRLTDRLAQAFIGDKVERLVLDQRTTETSTELILLECRIGPAQELVEVVGRIEAVVAVVLEQGAVQLIGARLGDGVDRDAVAAELRAIGVRQHLVFGDRLNTQRGPELARPAAAVPVVLHVGVVHQEHLSLRPRTRDRILRLPSEELLELSASSRRRNFVGAGRKDDQLRVAAIDGWQLGHLLLLNDRSQGDGHRVDNRRVRRHGDGFLHRRWSEREVHHCLGSNDQADPLTNDGLKP